MNSADQPSLFDEVRTSCAHVAAVSSHVRIHPERIENFAASIDLTAPANDPGQDEIGDVESTVAFSLTLNSINFGSGYFPYLRKRPGHSGYHTVAASLRDWIAATGPITTQRLASQTVNDWAEVFGQELDGSPAQELMELFTLALHDLAAFVDRTGAGSFLAVVDAADGSADRFAQSLSTMPFFHDVHHHELTGPVSLFKRAQIAAHDLYVTFDGRGPGAFDDIDQLTMFADNLVPHVLRVEGVLAFSPELLARIEAVDDITVGSTQEIEIRACGVHAVELLADQLRAHHGLSPTGLTTGTVDNLLWNLGAAPRYKDVPRHRSRCVYY